MSEFFFFFFVLIMMMMCANSTRYEQMVVRVNGMREELHTEIERMLNDVIKFKIHVQKNLDDFEGFVADEVEKELVRDGIPEEDAVMADV